MIATILGFLSALVPYLPGIVALAGYIIQLFGNSQANLAAYQALIENNKDSGKISVESATILAQYHQQMAAEMAARAQAHANIAKVLKPA